MLCVIVIYNNYDLYYVNFLFQEEKSQDKIRWSWLRYRYLKVITVTPSNTFFIHGACIVIIFIYKYIFICYILSIDFKYDFIWPMHLCNHGL